MAKKWGKRGKQAGQSSGLDADPRNMFGMPQAPRSAPPASSTPLADHLRRGGPGIDPGYVVLPRSIAESMPLPWQQQMANLLAQFHETHARLSWPTYRVVPSRPERLIDLDEEQLAEAGYLVEIDSDGEMVYRERSGKRVEDPDNTTVLVSCLDPIVRGAQQAVQQAPAPSQGRPAPMNIGPQPVWRTTSGSANPPAPPLPPPPTARSVSSPKPRQSPEQPEVAEPETAAPKRVPVEDLDLDLDTPPRGIPMQQPVSRPEPASAAPGSTPVQDAPEAAPPDVTQSPADPGRALPQSGSQPEQAPQAGSQPEPRVVEPPREPAPQPRSTAQPERAPRDSEPAQPVTTAGERDAERPVRQPQSGREQSQRGWFDEMSDAGSGPGAGRGAAGAARGGEFGPTGDEPTEIPYRYDR
ncbi:hypothetical protein [Prauserella cavernicola]|uniref:Uncharacterized protein n=1 Tax=Prauserella cavernicola TaxID=2800127 RepID=A0A934QZB6_9PSEU|nr:hypothetical protein [Prauserella cavernicola]MBK1789005.1 hypothetical protein [Prauserella cavernicola]